MRGRLLLLMLTGLLTVLACGRGTESPETSPLFKRTKVTVRTEVLDDYCGVYRLPSGALLRIFRQDQRLMAGIRPFELFAQTTRRFESNRTPMVVIFDRAADQPVRLNLQQGERELWIEKVDADQAVDPTMMVDAGGHRLRMLVTGTGSPTVILEDGFGNCLESQSELQSELSRFTRVVTYDHAGMGGSEQGPAPRDARQVAGELHRALQAAQIEPPYVLVGSSIGGAYTRVFAHAFPQDTCGLVWLDPTPDWQALHAWARQYAPDLHDRYREMESTAEAFVNELMKHQEPARRAEWEQVAETQRQARRALPLPDIPILQISGASGHQIHSEGRDKVRFYEHWLAEHVPHARHVLAEKSGHSIFVSQPELVIREIRALLHALRETPTPPSP